MTREHTRFLFEDGGEFATDSELRRAWARGLPGLIGVMADYRIEAKAGRDCTVIHLRCERQNLLVRRLEHWCKAHGVRFVVYPIWLRRVF